MGKKKIVIIDDEEDLCQLMKAYLEEMDHEVFLANTLGSGLTLMKEVSPDVLFIDNNLPDGLGWEKMSYLAKHFPDCKINLISAYQSNPVHIADSTLSIRVLEKPLSLNSLKEYL